MLRWCQLPESSTRPSQNDLIIQSSNVSAASEYLSIRVQGKTHFVKSSKSSLVNSDWTDLSEGVLISIVQRLNDKEPLLNDETRYRLLKLLESSPEVSQRVLARKMGVSIGKVNYCLRALMEKGWVKVKNFSRNPRKRIYAYYLTTQGAEEKLLVTARFLERKMVEYEEIRREIARLNQEINLGNTKSHDVAWVDAESKM